MKRNKKYLTLSRHVFDLSAIHNTQRAVNALLNMRLVRGNGTGAVHASDSNTVIELPASNADIKPFEIYKVGGDIFGVRGGYVAERLIYPFVALPPVQEIAIGGNASNYSQTVLAIYSDYNTPTCFPPLLPSPLQIETWSYNIGAPLSSPFDLSDWTIFDGDYCLVWLSIKQDPALSYPTVSFETQFAAAVPGGTVVAQTTITNGVITRLYLLGVICAVSFPVPASGPTPAVPGSYKIVQFHTGHIINQWAAIQNPFSYMPELAYNPKRIYYPGDVVSYTLAGVTSEYILTNTGAVDSTPYAVIGIAPGTAGYYTSWKKLSTAGVTTSFATGGHTYFFNNGVLTAFS